MLIIRLQRKGRRNEPTFRVVLTDSKNGPKSGKFLEVLGSYDPRDKNITKIDADKVKEWISKGAQLSDTVRNILINQEIIEGKKVNVLPKKSPIVKEKGEGEEPAPVTETEASEISQKEKVDEDPVEKTEEAIETEEKKEEEEK